MKDTMKLTAERSLFCAALTFFFAVAGCSHKHPSPLMQNPETNEESATGIPPLTEQKSDPLTQADIALYLKVMRAAAARVRKPSEDDTRTLARAKQIMAASASGHAPDAADADELQRASQIYLSMDQIVVREMGIDAANYTAIADAIEAVIPNPSAPMVSTNTRALRPRSPFERRIAEVNAENLATLAPYRAEIQSLLGIVRNPANLPTS